MLGFGFLRERRAKAVVANTLPGIPEGLQSFGAVDRAATLAIANAMLEAATDFWGASVSKGPSAIPKAAVVDIVLSLARSHAEITRTVLEPNLTRNMQDILFAQAMREIRAREILIGTLGSSLVEGRKPGVGQAWKLLWMSRGHANEAALALSAFARHAKADAVPRTKARPKLAKEADLVRLASTLPAFLAPRQPKPAARKPSAAKPVAGKAPAGSPPPGKSAPGRPKGAAQRPATAGGRGSAGR